MNEDKPYAKGESRTPISSDREGKRDQPSNTPLGSHPVGTGVGAVAGAVAAGAAAGSAAGPIGAAVGAVVGGVAGGLAGKGIAHLVDPHQEDEYWRQNWQDRSYIEGGYTYEDDYGPAYRYGVDAYTRYPERRYDELETDLSAGWKDARGSSRLEWDRARHATRDAWQRLSDKVERATPGDSDRDGK
jgi:hypothetical protein